MAAQEPTRNVFHLLLLGLVFHLVMINSVFDCYFTSPVVHGMAPHKLSKPSSKRLVLIVGDGLRADLLLNKNAFPNIQDSPEVMAPHLREIIESRGAFGISHTRVPTESRPGHVALIAGMYEDVSAVTKGWKTNPVDFDSVFNQSSHTFSFGSPDILPMFARGATPGKVRTWSYGEEAEDFTKDAVQLDFWVLDNLKQLFQNASTDATLDSYLRSDQVVFFLHLIGLDTTGHSYRPHSKEYMRNIQAVDDIVRQTEMLLSEFYQDEETSFVFSADHGMSDIGNHGDGHPDNTRTPLIAWGSGIRSPLPDSTPSSHDAYSKPWGLEHVLRRDMEQADVTALMSALLGVHWPANSVGVLPEGYLAKGEEKEAEAGLVNAKVILEHYRVKRELKQKHTLVYRPFSGLDDISPIGTDALQISLSEIEELLVQKQWADARMKSSTLIQLGLKGLRYLETYDRDLIRGVVIAAYTGWIAYVIAFLLPAPQKTQSSNGYRTTVTVAAILVFCAFSAIFAVQRSPPSFFLYIAFPCYFWREVLAQGLLFTSSGRSRWYASTWFMAGIKLVSVIGALQVFVAAYTHRSLWSIGFVFIGVIWPLALWPFSIWEKNLVTGVSWVGVCLLTAVFPLLPVDKEESVLTILAGGALMVVAGTLVAIKEAKSRSLKILFGTQVSLIVLIMAVTTSSALNLQAKMGLSLPNQIAGWSTLLLASSIPFLSTVQHTTSQSKLLLYFLGFAPCFVILSISVEGLFYVGYTATLVVWIQVETLLRGRVQAKVYNFQGDDLRIALFFLFFVQVGFFGTGNVASISSFYLEPVYRLVPIFNPFLMASLLVFKIIAPYVILSTCFATLNAQLGLPPFSLLLVALSLIDGMTIPFFLNVSDTGSWLEIGQSISFFCITSMLLVWSAGWCAAGEVMMRDVIRFKESRVD